MSNPGQQRQAANLLAASLAAAAQPDAPPPASNTNNAANGINAGDAMDTDTAVANSTLQQQQQQQRMQPMQQQQPLLHPAHADTAAPGALYVPGAPVAAVPGVAAAAVLSAVPAAGVVSNGIDASSGQPLIPLHDLSSLPPAQQAFCAPLLQESSLRHARHQHAEVIAVLDRLLSVIPNFVPAWVSRGLAFKALKDNVSAVQSFQRALELDPRDWTAHDQLGLIFKETELFEKAMEQYRLAILYGPEQSPAKEHLAVVLTDFGTRLKLAGSTEKAVQSYNEALAVYPAYWPAHFNLGVVCSERREFDLAMSHYQMAVERNPTYVEALCVASHTLVAVAGGKVLSARDVTTQTMLVGQHGEPLQVLSVRHGSARRMVRLEYEHGAHVVTPNHLVTLRWGCNPAVSVLTRPGGDTELRLTWWDRVELTEKSAVWTSLPGSLASRATEYALWWLEQKERAGLAAPLRRGDLIDVSADELLERLSHNAAFMSRVALPLVRTSQSIDSAVASARKIVPSDVALPPALSSDPAEVDTLDALNVHDDVAAHAAAFLSTLSAQVPAAAAHGTAVDDEVALAMLETDKHTQTVRVRVDEAGKLAYEPSSLSHGASIIYMLHAASSQQSALDHSSLAAQQLERAWSDLGVDVAQAQVVLTELLGDSSADENGCRAAMIAALHAPGCSVIVACGEELCARWRAEAVALPGVASVDAFTRTSIDGPLTSLLRMQDGRSVRLVLSPHPRESWRYADLLCSIAEAHGVAVDSPTIDKLAWACCVPLHSIVAAPGEEYVAIAVSGSTQRFVLADSVLTHNCNIGVIYKNSGELKLSIEYYERALKANPNFAIANSNLAIACTDMGTQVKSEGPACFEKGTFLWKANGQAVPAKDVVVGDNLFGTGGQKVLVQAVASSDEVPPPLPCDASKSLFTIHLSSLDDHAAAPKFDALTVTNDHVLHLNAMHCIRAQVTEWDQQTRARMGPGPGSEQEGRTVTLEVLGFNEGLDAPQSRFPRFIARATVHQVRLGDGSFSRESEVAAAREALEAELRASPFEWRPTVSDYRAFLGGAGGSGVALQREAVFYIPAPGPDHPLQFEGNHEPLAAWIASRLPRDAEEADMSTLVHEVAWHVALCSAVGSKDAEADLSSLPAEESSLISARLDRLKIQLSRLAPQRPHLLAETLATFGALSGPEGLGPLLTDSPPVRAHALAGLIDAVGVAVVGLPGTFELAARGAPTGEGYITLARGLGFHASVACKGAVPSSSSTAHRIVVSGVRTGDLALSVPSKLSHAAPRSQRYGARIASCMAASSSCTGWVAIKVSAEDSCLLTASSLVVHNCDIAGGSSGGARNSSKLDEGILYYKKALHHHSRYPAAWYNLGVAYAEKCRFDDSKVCYEMAVLFDPKCAEAYNNLGVIYKDRGNLDQAIHYYNAAMVANPKFSQTMNNLGVIYTMLGKLDEAHEYCSRAIATNPLYAEAHNNLGVLYRDEGRITEALASYEACLAIDPLSRNAGQNRLLAMNSLSSSRPASVAGAGAASAPGAAAAGQELFLSEAERAEVVWQAHRQWGQHFQAMFDKERYTEWNYAYQLPEDGGSDGNGAPAASASGATAAMSAPSSIPRGVATRRPLRIGYLSADFFTHSVSYFIEAPLAWADPARTFITCYSNVARRDKKTAHLQTLAHAWRPVHELGARGVAELMRQDRIDILVELTGHTAGNRLDVLALKPAPVACTWIGYPNSTGLPTIDYRLSDSVVDPPDTAQQYSEELVRMEGPFLCYTPPPEAPAVTPTPALAKGYITFGSFNNLAKVNDRVLDAWCRILLAVPTSRMLIKCKPFASPSVCGKMWSRFAARGVDSERVDLVSLLPTTSEHLDAYGSVDISVDTFPYAGTTTTCEALYQGVPVVTFERRDHPAHAHNVGATLLSRIKGCERLIAHSEDEYVSIAVSLASDLSALQSLRASLRPSMLSSPVCDGRTFVSRLTDTYEQLWARHCRGEKARPSNRLGANV